MQYISYSLPILNGYFKYIDSSNHIQTDFTHKWIGTAVMRIFDNRGQAKQIRFLLDCKYPYSKIKKDIVARRKWKYLNDNVVNDILKLKLQNHSRNFNCTLNLKLKDKNSLPKKIIRNVVRKKIRNRIVNCAVKKKKCLADPNILRKSKQHLKVDGVFGRDVLSLFQFIEEETMGDILILDSPFGVILGSVD